MNHPNQPAPQVTAENSTMTTRIRSIGRWVGPKVQYLVICAGLVGILKLGHATHWSISVPSFWAEDARSSDSPPPAKPTEPPVVALGDADADPSPQFQTVSMTDSQLEKSGVKLHRVALQPMDETLTVHGVVSYNRNLVAQLSSRVPGNVWRVVKQAGETIRKGDVLAIVEAIEVGEVKADLLRAIVEADLKRSTVERLEAAGEALAEKLVREAEAEERQARIKVRNLLQTLVNLGLPVTLDELVSLDDEQRARKLQFLGLPDSLARTLDPATTTANLVPLVAPFDGVVIGREITLGETVAPNDAHFVIADCSRMWVELEIRKEDANLVRIGQPIQFRADGIPGTLVGTVDWISTEVDPETRTLKARAEVANATIESTEAAGREQRMLRANTFGTGGIVVRSNPVAVVVPNDAVHFDGREHFVFARDGATFHKRVIRPGVVDGAVTEVRAGLSEGELIAAAGSHLVKSELALVAMQP